LSDRRTRWKRTLSPLSPLIVIGFLVLSGCNVKESLQNSRLYHRIARENRSNPAVPVPDKMAIVGRDAITAECATESYANASKGLIVGETGLHEDVFALRDPATLTANVYGMKETLTLEAMLRKQATAVGPATEQAACINQFAQHLQSLTDALKQADNLQKELDVSAFNDSRKEAEEQLEKSQHEIEQSGPPTPH
jgi:hypothetical protein